MLADDNAVLADDDALGISLDLDRPADGTRTDRILVVVEAHQAGLGNRGLRRPKNRLPIGTSWGRSASKTCQIVRSASSGCLFVLA
jgi:hypothetical protein